MALHHLAHAVVEDHRELAGVAGNTHALRKLRAVFGQMPLTPFAPRLVYQYVDRRGAKVAGHREIEVLAIS
jgi:hypothetical protein